MFFLYCRCFSVLQICCLYYILSRSMCLLFQSGLLLCFFCIWLIHGSIGDVKKALQKGSQMHLVLQKGQGIWKLHLALRKGQVQCGK